MAEFPALPIWTDAILADCGYMTDEKFGAYHRLLYLIWRSPECRVPNDDLWLAERLARSVETVRSLYRPHIRDLCGNDGNWITQGRLIDEKKYLKKRYRKQSDNAKSRWNKEKDICHGNAQSGITPTPTPTPTPLSVSKDTDIPPTPNEGSNDAKPKRTRKQPTHIDNGFAPDLDGLKLASDLNLDPEQTTREFIDYWKSVGKPMCDWQAAFRNRLRQLAKYRAERAERETHGRRNVQDVVGATLHVIKTHNQNQT